MFVSGLPMDAKPRELYLLFRGFSGFEGSLLKVTNKSGKNLSVSGTPLCSRSTTSLLKRYLSPIYLQPVGFVTFASRADAETAKHELTVRLLYHRGVIILLLISQFFSYSGCSF